MAKIVFSKGIRHVWGTDLASTLVGEEEVQVFLELYEQMAAATPSFLLKEGDVIIWADREYMILELTNEERERLSEARAAMTGERGVEMMICERTSELTRHNLLTERELEGRRGREIRL